MTTAKSPIQPVTLPEQPARESAGELPMVVAVTIALVITTVVTTVVAILLTLLF